MKKPKYTVHRKITNVPESPVNGLPKVVKITVTDPCATDSSSDEETEESIFPEPRIKRYVEEIRFSDAKPVKKPVVTEKVDGGTVKYRGVRQRPWGKFAAEIRDSSTRTRIWLGTFATAYEAAIGYDKAAIRLKGHNALTNFLTPPPPPPATNSSPISPPVIDIETVSGCDSARESQSSLCSPTSVLRFYRNDGTEFIPEHGTEYGTGFGTEQNKVSSGESKVVNEETPADLSTDSFFLPDLFQSGDIFWDSHIASSDPLFLDEMESFSVKDSDLFEGFPLSTIGDFNSGSWDVDEFFRE